MKKQLFTTKEIMNLLGLAQPTISKYVKKGMPVAGKVDFGKGNVYDLKEVTDWIKDNAKTAGRPKKEVGCMSQYLPFIDDEYEFTEEDYTEQELEGIDYTIDDRNENGVKEEETKNYSLIDITGKSSLSKLQEIRNTNNGKSQPFNQLPIQPKVFKHRDMPVYVREDLHDKVKREALRHNVTMKKLVEDIVAYHLEVKI